MTMHRMQWHTADGAWHCRWCWHHAWCHSGWGWQPPNQTRRDPLASLENLSYTQDPSCYTPDMFEHTQRTVRTVWLLPPRKPPLWKRLLLLVPSKRLQKCIASTEPPEFYLGGCVDLGDAPDTTIYEGADGDHIISCRYKIDASDWRGISGTRIEPEEVE
jgi:hypothetical protein